MERERSIQRIKSYPGHFIVFSLTLSSLGAGCTAEQQTSQSQPANSATVRPLETTGTSFTDPRITSTTIKQTTPAPAERASSPNPEVQQFLVNKFEFPPLKAASLTFYNPADYGHGFLLQRGNEVVAVTTEEVATSMKNRPQDSLLFIPEIGNVPVNPQNFELLKHHEGTEGAMVYHLPQQQAQIAEAIRQNKLKPPRLSQTSPDAFDKLFVPKIEAGQALVFRKAPLGESTIRLVLDPFENSSGFQVQTLRGKVKGLVVLTSQVEESRRKVTDEVIGIVLEGGSSELKVLVLNR